MNLLYGRVLGPLLRNLQREVITKSTPIIIGLGANTVLAAIL